MLFNRLKNVQTQTLLLVIAALLVLTAAIGVLGAWVTHSLKQHLVNEAHEYARKEVIRTCRHIEDIMVKNGVKSLESLSKMPEVDSAIRMTISQSDGAIRMVAILNRDHVELRQYRNDTLESEREVAAGSPVEETLNGNLREYSLKVERISPRQPLQAEPVMTEASAAPIGYLAWDPATDLSGSVRMQHLSRAITESLAWMVGLLLAVVAATAALVYKVFYRHLALEREKEAHARMATIGTLASGLAHEIRNPLQVINMNLDLIREEVEESAASDGDPGAAQTARTIGGIQSQVSHLNKILHDFIQYAIPGRIEREELNLRTVIGDTLEFMGPEFAKQGIEVECRIPEDVRVEGDSSSLRRVFLNILLNAVKAMERAPEKRLVVGAARGRAGMWELWFEDTGCGIPAGQEEKIFEAFVSFRPGGTGFGLAIARRVIEEHGGRIVAESKGESRGAIFRMTLPGLEPEGAAHSAHHRAAAVTTHAS